MAESHRRTVGHGPRKWAVPENRTRDGRVKQKKIGRPGLCPSLLFFEEGDVLPFSKLDDRRNFGSEGLVRW